MPILASTSSSASTITYATLRQGITDWTHRTDLDTYIPDFVRLAESEIRNDVRCRAMETTSTGTVASYTIAHPTDMIELRRMVVDGYVYSYIEAREFAELDRQDNATDYVFTSIGENFKVLTGEGETYTLIYWAPLTELTAESGTNWLLKNALDVYLFGCLKYYGLFTEDDTAVMKFDALYKGAVARVNDRERKAMVSGGRMLLTTDLGLNVARSNIFAG